MEGPDPADSPKGDIHRARPVHAVGVWVLGDPVRDLVDELLRVTLVTRQPVRLTQRDGMLKPAEFPWHLDVRRTVQLGVLNRVTVLPRPFAAGLEIGTPRQPAIERYRTGSQQLEFMTQRAVGLGQDVRHAVRKSVAKGPTDHRRAVLQQKPSFLATRP